MYHTSAENRHRSAGNGKGQSTAKQAFPVPQPLVAYWPPRIARREPFVSGRTTERSFCSILLAERKKTCARHIDRYIYIYI